MANSSDPDGSAQKSQKLSLEDHVTRLRDWVATSNHRDGKIALLDMRESDKFQQQRLSQCQFETTPFSVEFLKARSFELPARQVKFSILVDPADLQATGEFLLGKKRDGRKRMFNPWKVESVFLDTKELWEDATKCNLVDSTQYVQPFPHSRLWQPDPMVQTVLLPLLKKLPPVGSWEVWDLASGAGRDVAFLAEELQAVDKKEFKVVALDHRYNEKESNIVMDFFSRRGMPSRHTTCAMVDLSKLETLTNSAFWTGRIKAMFTVRFWKPELVEAIAKSELMAPGMIFGISHFCKQFEGASWDFEHPSEKTVLERDQLKNLFRDAWDILHDDISKDSDHGRTMIHFVARKKAT